MGLKLLHKSTITKKTPILNEKEITLEQCEILVNEEVYQINDKNESNLVIKKILFEHEDFKTVRQYIKFYKNKGYYFVDIS